MAHATATDYEVVIGLEVHAQLLTKSKMFCRCSADYASGAPNSHNCPICMGFPGTLPVINERAVDYAIMTALALNCEIAEFSKFDRKNYFYPDLPKGYQISQFDIPISHDGYLSILVNGEEKRIGITRVHMEEDTGRNVHKNQGGDSYTLVDLNRAGVPLMEIVGEPDLRTPEEARLYVEKLRQILIYLGVNSGKMEDGALRCDANISVRVRGAKDYGAKVEIKNMNSFRAVERALAFEAKRQIEDLEAGKTIAQQTRGWRDDRGITVAQRTKEYADDYRYFPEPDLPPLIVSRERVAEIRAAMPELPDAKRQRFIATYGLSLYDAEQLVSERATADYFEATLAAGGKKSSDQARAKAAANWITGELRRLSHAAGHEVSASKVTPKALAELLDLLAKDTINSKQAKDVFEHAFETGESPSVIVKREGMTQLSDAGELEEIVAEVIAAHPKAVEDYRAGKQGAVQFLVGQVMRQTKGRARPDAVQPLLMQKLGGA
ncbi:MAG TPA: Asp-tRNA(Asn)/Glu-tRNA(Gln) amidotransferase subunit GatB [Ktedonobacterales bacterium]